MSDSNKVGIPFYSPSSLCRLTESQAGNSSMAGKQRHETRSRYEKDQQLDLSTSVSFSLNFAVLPSTCAYARNQYPEPNPVGKEMYLKGTRGIDPKPYKIHEVLGDGQYKLLRDGKCDGKIYLQENLRSEP